MLTTRIIASDTPTVAARYGLSRRRVEVPYQPDQRSGAKTSVRRPYDARGEASERSDVTVDGDRRTITAELVDGVARSETNEDIDVYLERHGIDGLATALEYAREYVDGTVNARIAARELDCSVLEAEIILQALEPVVLAHRDE